MFAADQPNDDGSVRRAQQDAPDPVPPTGRVALPGSLLPGVAAFLAACALGLFFAQVTALVPGDEERSVMLVGVSFALLLPIPAIAYAAAKRDALVPERLALVVLLSLAVLLTGLDLFWLGARVVFPGDLLAWSESSFVNDIIKLRVGYPLYTAQANNESSIYMPGSKVVTLLLATLAGKGDSIVAYRTVQVGYTAAAALVAVLCCRRLISLAAPGRPLGGARLWSALWMPVFFLLASNAITNPYVQNLHNDALAQLITITGYWLLLEYAAMHDRRVLALMALIPAAGFLVKQNLALWAPLYCVYLVAFDKPRSLRLTGAFAAFSFGALGIAAAACYIEWGEPFRYWTITVLNAHAFSVLRSVVHITDAWAYFAVGFVGGLVLIRGPRLRILVGPWLVWLAIILVEAYTSGIASMLNHLGPGCLIAGTWFLAAVALAWPAIFRGADDASTRVTGSRGLRLEEWLRPAATVAIAALVFAGLGTIRISSPQLPRDATRYVMQIQREFQGFPASAVLLDAGSWVYLRDGVVMKDRATSMGDRGYGGVGDFSGMIRRLGERRYAKILVHNYHSPNFWYDHYSWRTPSGLRRALAANYHEVGTIPAVRQGDPTRRPHYLFGEISILVPNAAGHFVRADSGLAGASSFRSVK